MSEASSPETGQNIIGIARTKNDGEKLVRVIYYDESLGFYHCREVETGKQRTIHYQDFTKITK